MTPYFGNGSSDRKKALKKNTRFENNPKSVCTKSHEGFDENSVSTSRKKLLIPLAGIMFFLKNWPTFNFKIGVHQQKKALNKNKKFVINKKTFPLARMKDSLKKNDFSGPKDCIHLNQCLKSVQPGLKMKSVQPRLKILPLKIAPKKNC